MLCDNLEGWDGAGGGREVQRGRRYNRNKDNIVKQLYTNLKNNFKIKIEKKKQVSQS